ncbi:MAG: Golgi phosphoprotein 3 [Microbacteriaceae bacterium]|jgi:hypothetical protein|nr:Golgi phosphoprotein 3 [Microbacteriaceae bacterium]
MPADADLGDAVTTDALSLAEEVYLVLHYEPLGGALLRNGKVNGSEVQAISASKIVDLVDAGAVTLERPRRSTSHSLVVDGQAPQNPVLAEALELLAAQRKQRSLGWGLSNLGATAPIVERLVGLGMIAAERKPEAPLTATGLAALGGSRAALDAAVLDGEGNVADRAILVAAVIHAAKVWRNVYPAKERAEREAIVKALARLGSAAAAEGGDRARVIGLLEAEAVAA